MVLDTNQSVVPNVSLLSYNEMLEGKITLLSLGQLITELRSLVTTWNSNLQRTRVAFCKINFGISYLD